MLIKRGILFEKTMLVVSYSKALRHTFIPTIYEKFLYYILYLAYIGRTNENLETCMPVWFEQIKELKQSWGTFTELI